MTIEGVASTLEERGIVWQGVGFATVGAMSMLLLSVYSEASPLEHRGLRSGSYAVKLGVCVIHRFSYRKDQKNVRDENRDPSRGEG